MQVPPPHLLERHALGEQIFALVNAHLAASGLSVSCGTIVDATIINAPSSTNNKTRARDPEMRQTKKRNQWYFGMKAHLGIDSKSKLIHSAIVTAASVNDSTILPDILHGAETRVWSEAAYAGQTAAIRRCAPTAKDSTHEKTTRSHSLTDKQKASNATESKVRTRGEHPFLVIKRIFGFVKTRYRGLMKNANRLFVACALVNLFMMRRAQFAAREGGVRPPFAETPKQDGSGAEKQGPNGLLGLASCLKSTWRVRSRLIRASLISIAAKTSSFLAVV